MVEFKIKKIELPRTEPPEGSARSYAQRGSSIRIISSYKQDEKEGN